VPSLASALTLLGDLLFDKRDMAGALECFERLARQRPDDGRLWNNLALAQLALGRLDDAEAAARRARTLDPGSAVAWLNLGRALAARGHREGALGALAESLRLDPANADAHDLAGRMHAQDGGFTRAVKSFRSALDAGAGAMTASRLGDAAMRLGDAAAAIAAYRDAESRDRTQAAENASRALFAMHADERASPSTTRGPPRVGAALRPGPPCRPPGNSRDPTGACGSPMSRRGCTCPPRVLLCRARAPRHAQPSSMLCEAGCEDE